MISRPMSGNGGVATNPFESLVNSFKEFLPMTSTVKTQRELPSSDLKYCILKFSEDKILREQLEHQGIEGDVPELSGSAYHISRIHWILFSLRCLYLVFTPYAID
jgi:hypothetical protein